MMRVRLSLAAPILIAALIAGAATGLAEASTAVGGDAGRPPAVSSQQAFAGALEGLSIGRGRIRSRIVGLDRGFLVWTRGRQQGDVFELDQFFRFDDGAIDRRLWRFRRVAPDRWVGERQDLAAPATLVIDGRTLRLSYDLLLKRARGGPVRLHCEDRIERLASGALLSRGTIYRFGVPVGSVETHLVPGAGPPAISGRPPSSR